MPFVWECVFNVVLWSLKNCHIDADDNLGRIPRGGEISTKYMLICTASITVLLVINWINYHRYRWFCILCFTYDMLKHIWFDDAYFENRNVWLFLSDPGVPGFLFCRMLKIEMFYYSFFSSAECQRWSKRMGRGQVGDDVIQNLNHKIEIRWETKNLPGWPVANLRFCLVIFKVNQSPNFLNL